MKKILSKAVGILLIISIIATGNNCFEVLASNSNKVSYIKKNGTVTIYGKGKMLKSMTFGNKKGIKKVIVKNKVTSISKRAFYNCKNLKKVKIGNKVKTIGRYAFYNTKISKLVLPDSVKTIGVGAFNTKSTIKKASVPGKLKTKTALDGEKSIVMSNVDTVEFTTNLKLNTLYLFNAKNYNVKSNDKNYSSIDGVIYSKDGSKVVRLPNRDSISIAKGCTEFDFISYMYALYVGDDMYETQCDDVKKITLPSSVSKILNSTETDTYVYPSTKCSLEAFEILNTNIDEESLNIVKKSLGDKYVMEKTDSSIIFKLTE